MFFPESGSGSGCGGRGGGVGVGVGVGGVGVGVWGRISRTIFSHLTFSDFLSKGQLRIWNLCTSQMRDDKGQIVYGHSLAIYEPGETSTVNNFFVTLKKECLSSLKLSDARFAWLSYLQISNAIFFRLHVFSFCDQSQGAFVSLLVSAKAKWSCFP
jgi:hypothetical protein